MLCINTWGGFSETQLTDPLAFTARYHKNQNPSGKLNEPAFDQDASRIKLKETFLILHQSRLVSLSKINT
jgi:hypothetical protein